MVLWGEIAILRNMIKQSLRKTNKSAKRSSLSCVSGVVSAEGSWLCGGSNKSEIERRETRSNHVNYVARVTNYTQSGRAGYHHNFHKFGQYFDIRREYTL
jgi:hypothetical protein